MAIYIKSTILKLEKTWNMLEIVFYRNSILANFVTIHPEVFEILHAEDFLPNTAPPSPLNKKKKKKKKKKKSIKWTILNFKKIKKYFSNTVFAYIKHGKYQNTSFNSNEI